MSSRTRELPYQRDEEEVGERPIVVGIGASAGGLEAFERVLRGLPVDSGMAFVLVQHLDPTHESALVQILAKATALPVLTIEDGHAVAPNTVHVIPPNTALFLDGGKLRLASSERVATRLPINAFFTSLAEDQRALAVGVVLSGTGSDGAMGLTAIKQHGGATIVQAPQDARFDGMPNAGIATGVVDRVLAADEIPAALLQIAAARRASPGESEHGQVEGLRDAFEILLRRTGHDFSRYRRSTVFRRFLRRMAASGLLTMREYAQRLADDQDEVHRLLEDLLINVTEFFRDPEAFRVVERVVLPELLARRPSSDLRIWVPGCSSGEEAYSIAMLILEHTDRSQDSRRFQIFATDIDAAALATARQGRYTAAALQVSPERLARFFTAQGGAYTIVKEVRDSCIFTTQDLLRDPPFSRMDLVSCRNLLIYLQPDLQRRAVELLHYALRPGGVLLLGRAEAIDGRDMDLFEAVSPGDRVFRRRDVALPASRVPRLGGGIRSSNLQPSPPGRLRGAEVRSIAERSQRVLVDEFTPPSVVVDVSGEIQYLWGARLSRYLELRSGVPATNVAHLVRHELRVELIAALHAAARLGRQVVHRDMTVDLGSDVQALNLVVRPLPAEEGKPQALFLVVFEEIGRERAKAGGTLVADTPATERVQQLESALASAQERIQTTSDEIESANDALRTYNDELESLNEELHSSNEEFQTTQEELQSVNEELNTVNAELSTKVDELAELYGDLQNLFQSTQIATLFLDREMRIERYTPAATVIFGLVDTDVGRPIENIAARFQDGDVAGELRDVLSTLRPREREVHLADATRWFLMRIHPYRTGSGTIAGLVLSFVDVTQLKATEKALRQAVDERERAEVALRDADRHKDDFLAVLAHELRNPLAPIRNGLELLEHIDGGGEQARRLQAILMRQTGHLARIVDDLLEVTRIARGKLQVQRERIELGDLVVRTAEDHRPVLEANGIELEVSPPDGPAWIDGDATRLSQVLGNLLHNAAKFTPRGGRVRVSVAREPPSSAVLRVEDDGMGIDPAMLVRMFEPFVQADDGLDRGHGGLGLGLALVKGLVELHDGSVEVRSDGAGKGAALAVRLPLASPPAATPNVAEDPTREPRRVLLIEDNEDAATTLCELLELAGHTLAVAQDGRVGLETARRFGPDVVLCDIGLPGMSGYDVARAFRADAALRDVFLVALSGYATPEDKQRAIDAGFARHLAKPMPLAQIEDVLARAPARAR